MGNQTMVEMNVQGIGVDTSNRPVVLLRESAGNRQLPIWIGPMEAVAIADHLRGNQPERPMTHDLLCSLLSEVGCAIEMLTISDLKESVYHAQLYVRAGEETHAVDCRPSDGIAVALRAQAPITMPDDLLERIRSEHEIVVEETNQESTFPVDSGDETIH